MSSASRAAIVETSAITMVRLNIDMIVSFLAATRSEPPAAKGADCCQWWIAHLHPAFCELKMRSPQFGKNLSCGIRRMTREAALVDLTTRGVQELIRLTNQQFRLWGNSLAAETTEEIRPGDLMDYWFILSALAQHPPEFRLNKKEAFSIIPNLKPETVRRYVADAGRLGFVETVKSKGKVYLQLTPAGQNALANTLTQWIAGFSDIHRLYFDDR